MRLFHAPISRRLAKGMSVAAAMSVLTLANPCQAVEQASDFLAALRARGMHDMAAVYLEKAADSRLTSEGFRRRIPLERARGDLDQAAATRDPDLRELLLASSVERLRSLAGHNDDSAAEAALLLGRTLAASAQIAAAEEGGESAARKLYREAEQAYASAREKLRVLHRDKELIRAAATDPASQERLIEIRRRIMEVRLGEPTVILEQARTFDDLGGATDLYRRAADAFEEVIRDYRRYGVAQIALLRQGQCFAALGDSQRALGCFGELLDAGGGPEVKDLLAKAARAYLELVLSADEPEYGEGAAQGQAYLERYAAGRAPTQEDAAVYYLTAQALSGLAAAAQPNSPQFRQARGAAREYARTAAEHPSDYQGEARELLAELTGREPDEAPSEIKTFAEARRAAAEAFSSWQTAVTAVRAAGANATETEKQNRSQAREAAIAVHRLALDLAREEHADEIDDLRYYLAFLYWDAGDYEEAAVLGDYLARKTPSYKNASQAARVGVAALDRLRERGGDLAASRLERLASWSVSRWPSEAVGQAALVVLLRTIGADGDPQKALNLVERIDENSPHRGAAEIQAGQSLWHAANAGEVDDAQRARLRSAAEELLRSGRDRLQLQPDASPASRIAAATTLAQMQLADGDVSAAEALLVEPDGGVLGLVDRADALQLKPELVQAVLRTAIQVRLSNKPPRTDIAERHMDRLEESVGGDAANLPGVYLALCRDLQNQVASLREAGSQIEASAAEQALGVVLARAARGADASFAGANWTAAAFYDMAERASGGEPAGARGPAREHYGQAAELYRKIVDRAGQPGYPSDDMLAAFHLRLVRSLRGAGRAADAYRAAVEMLRQKNNALTAQQEAAYALQQLGSSDAGAYAKAMLGDQDEGGQKLIWGWVRIAKLTNGRDNLEDAHYEARWNIARCRLGAAQAESDSQRKAALLAAAKSDLFLLARLRPQVMQTQWRGKFDAVVQAIQRAQGEQPTGLAGLVKQ